MGLLAQYTEVLHLGVVDDLETDSRQMLTELVTVCPECRTFNSLHRERRSISCSACGWATRLRETTSRQA